MIKFDLPINGMQVKNIEQLREHFNIQILDHYRSKRLAKWLSTRSLKAELAALELLAKQEELEDRCLFKQLCEIFMVEIDEDNFTAMIKKESQRQSAETYGSMPEADLNCETNPAFDGFMKEIETVASNLREPIKTRKDDIRVIMQPRTFTEIIESVKYKFNDEDVYYGEDLYKDKVKKKIMNAVNSYVFRKPPEKLLIFIDITVFGSGKLGFYITDAELYMRAQLEQRFVVKFKDIKSISHRGYKASININGDEHKYVQSSHADAIEIIVESINEYIQQFR